MNRCRFGWHKWTAWEPPESETWMRHEKGDDKSFTFVVSVQKRRFRNCDMVERREVYRGIL